MVCIFLGAGSAKDLQQVLVLLVLLVLQVLGHQALGGTNAKQPQTKLQSLKDEKMTFG